MAQNNDNEQNAKKHLTDKFGEGSVISRVSRINRAKDIAGRILMLYDEKDKTGDWELNKATDAIYDYIRELEQS